MSTLSVASITTTDSTTDLVLTTANTNSGNVRIFSTNNTILLNGNIIFSGNTPSITAAFDKANNAATTGKAIAMAIVFG